MWAGAAVGGSGLVKLFLGVVLVGMALVGLVGAGGAQAAFPGDNGRIAITSERDGNLEIYSMASDGSDVVRLTNDDADDFQPAWSPDGARIAFTSDRDGDNEVYSVAPDGSDVVRLTTDDEFDGQADWQIFVSPPPPPPPPLPSPPPPGPPAPPLPAAPAPACLAETTPGFLYPAKTRVVRSRVLRSDRELDVLGRSRRGRGAGRCG